MMAKPVPCAVDKYWSAGGVGRVSYGFSQGILQGLSDNFGFNPWIDRVHEEFNGVEYSDMTLSF